MNLSRLLLRLVLGQRLSVKDDELRVLGSAAPITIRRNKWGIPAIEAENDEDAAYGLGFCHGQDRAAQIEAYARIGRGRLAEWVGASGLPTDRMSRRIGFRRAAEKQFGVVCPEIQQMTAAFARGVNAGRTLGLSARPHEFAILGGEPIDFDGIDVLTILKLQSFQLASNWDVELARLRVLRADGPEALRDLDPIRVEASSEASSHPALDQLAADLASLLQFAPLGGGSNNWVLAGQRTASGKPILASDPHLSPTVPAPWYVAHVRTPRGTVVGAGIPGTPAFAIGHNGTAAWGVTAGLTDNTDLFLETLGPDGVSVRESDGRFQACEVVKEVISTKGSSDVIEEVLVTPRGPIITPLVPGVNDAISFRSVWLDPLPVDGLLSSTRADSFESFRAPFAHWPVLPLSIVYADTHGTTGWLLTGVVPQRGVGHGLLPTPVIPGSEWASEHVPFDRMPWVKNPAEGFFATANNPPEQSMNASPGDWAFLGRDYIDDYRFRTITEELAKRTNWTPTESLRLQCNVHSLPWEELRPIVLSLQTEDINVRDALAVLRSWHGQIEINSAGATIFELFVAEMCVRLAKAKAPKSWLVMLGESPFGSLKHNLFTDRRVAHLVKHLREQPPGWFARPWPDEMIDALAGVIRHLRKNVGPGPAYWGWGHLRKLRLNHPLFRGSRWLGPAFNLGPVPCAGDANTISQAGARPTAPTALTHNMANLRMVIDLADLAGSRFILCGGQSGNPCSPNYDDQFPLWQAGDSIPLPWNREGIIREATSTIRLLPDHG